MDGALIRGLKATRWWWKWRRGLRFCRHRSCIEADRGQFGGRDEGQRSRLPSSPQEEKLNKRKEKKKKERGLPVCRLPGKRQSTRKRGVGGILQIGGGGDLKTKKYN